MSLVFFIYLCGFLLGDILRGEIWSNYKYIG